MGTDLFFGCPIDSSGAVFAILQESSLNFLSSGGYAMNWNIPLFASLVAILISASAFAAVDFGVGKGSTDCSNVSREIIKDWFTMKAIMSPKSTSLSRPRERDFQRGSPRYVRDLAQQSSMGQTKLSCFTSESTGAICCDKQLRSCAIYAGKSDK